MCDVMRCAGCGKKLKPTKEPKDAVVYCVRCSRDEFQSLEKELHDMQY